MIRDNLKAAIAKSGLYVKEVADKSGVNKRTIDKWVGASKTEPKVNDLYKVCNVLGITMEWVVDGDIGSEFVRKVACNDPLALQVPDRIKDIVVDLLLLDNHDLVGIRAATRAVAEAKKTSEGVIANAG